MRHAIPICRSGTVLVFMALRLLSASEASDTMPSSSNAADGKLSPACCEAMMRAVVFVSPMNGSVVCRRRGRKRIDAVSCVADEETELTSSLHDDEETTVCRAWPCGRARPPPF